MLKLDMVPKCVNTTLRWTPSGVGSESEAVATASEFKRPNRRRVYTEVHEHNVGRKVTSDKLVGDVSSKARYVLRGFEADMKDEDVFASTTLTASVRMLLAFAIDRRNEQYTVFTADLKTTFFNASTKDRDVVYAEPPCGWSPETMASTGRGVAWELEKSVFALRSAPKRWQEHLEHIDEAGCVSNQLDFCLGTQRTTNITCISR